MKRCPECRRDYYDDSLAYCLEDGVALVQGSVPVAPGGTDEPTTAILHGTPSSEAATHSQVQTTEASGARIERGKQHLFANRTIAPLLIAVTIGILAIGAVFGYRYFNTANSATINSIAVLPLVNQSGNADTEYLSDGIAESLIFRLSQLPGLKVSPVSSVIRYKDKEFDARKIASDLGVQAVMSGRMAQRGDNLAISIELIDAANNKVIWGEQYERKMSDLLATQREIAGTIAQKLQLKLVGDEKGVAKKYTDSNEAYELYLKGRFHFARRSKVDLERSVELLTEATKLDPNFALAYVGIAEAYSAMTSFPFMAPKEAYPLANAAITKALELDPELAEAHTIAGMIATAYEWDYAKAEREFKRGIELNPDAATTHFRYGWTFLSPLGRHEEAIAEMKRAMELEPLAVQQGSNYAAVLMYARRFDEAVEQARRTYELDPSQIGAQNWLCHPLNAKGLYKDAIVIGERAASTQVNQVTSFRACLGIAYAKMGERDKALSIIKEVKELSTGRYISSYWIAAQYAALGDKNAAFAELENSFENRDFFLNRLKVDPFMDPLRDDPRFGAMVKRLNLPD